MAARELILAFSGIVGADHVLTDGTAMQPYLTDWRKRYHGNAIAIVRPCTTHQVAQVVRLCSQTDTHIVPQGGNTGLVGGATPGSDPNTHAIVLSMTRMNRVIEVDPIANTITAQAGVPLATLQQAAADHERLFPLSLASEGSCTLGGNLSTNAGGTAVLRYGNARELCLAIEAVTADGAIIGSRDGELHGLRKDNTGYSLRDLFIGAEGTLGVITAAVMRLYPMPRSTTTSLAAVSSVRDALRLLERVQRDFGNSVSGFELISQAALQIVLRNFSQCRKPFTVGHPFVVLIEITGQHEQREQREAAEAINALLGRAHEAGLVADAVIAQSSAQRDQFWALRELISEAQAKEGQNIKHDISIPIARIEQFIKDTDAAVALHFPGARMVTFGHLGDGNLHYNVSAPLAQPFEDFMREQPALSRLVHDAVVAAGGSISAEHGLGQLKREEILRYKSVAEMDVMRAIKRALDPKGIMNPGKVV